MKTRDEENELEGVKGRADYLSRRLRHVLNSVAVLARWSVGLEGLREGRRRVARNEGVSKRIYVTFTLSQY